VSVWTAVAALAGAAAVTLGALGTHGLRERIDPTLYVSWETAVHYQLFHAAALLALGLYADATGRSVRIPAALFTAGIALFCGGLLLRAGLGWNAAARGAPLGGLCLIAGWLSLLALRR
jgi:uncharacterized membrane protein YgdD (TMEM256/DUF423 family)